MASIGELMQVFSSQWEAFTSENEIINADKFQLPVFNLLTSKVKADDAADRVIQLAYPDGTETIYADFVNWVNEKASGKKSKKEEAIENAEEIQLLRESIARYLYATANDQDTFVISLKE